MGSKIVKKILAAAILSLIALPITAQQFDWDDPRINYQWDNNRNTISIYAGYNSMLGIATKNLYNEILAEIDPSKFVANQFNSNIPYGEYGLQYHYNVNRWCRLGAKAGFDVNKTTINNLTSTILYSTLMFSTQFTYYNEVKWRLYSGIDVGGSLLYLPQLESVIPMLAFNLNAFGFSYGKALIVFAEINLGFDAVIKGGIGLRL